MTRESPNNHASHWPHRFAVVLVCVTFPLIWVGGLVTTTESGMAVPDYPTTFGHNLFLYPLDTWLGGPWQVFIEHGHRLLGALSGLTTIALCLALWRCDGRRWMRWLGAAALLLVIGQGLLGGFRVIQNERLLAMVHGCVGPAFFGLSVALAVFTSRRWRQAAATVNAPAENSAVPAPRDLSLLAARRSRLARLALLVAILAYLQIVLGAQLRHVPVTASIAWFQTAVVFHVIVALAILLHAVWISWLAVRRNWRDKPLARPALCLAALVAVQVALGGGAWVLNYGWPEWFQGTVVAESHLTVARSSGQNLVTTAHVAVGSLIFATAVLLALRGFRFAASNHAPRAAEEKPRRAQEKREHAGSQATNVIALSRPCAPSALALGLQAQA